jgi:threonine/homoserine/homoserine lactone efflux protein
VLAGVNPKNLMLAVAAGSGFAKLGLSTAEAIVSLVVFVVIASLTIAGTVAYYLFGGETAKARLCRSRIRGVAGRSYSAALGV